MKSYSSEIAKMNMNGNMCASMCMCMCSIVAFQKVDRI
jgi:hypothetical protein